MTRSKLFRMLWLAVFCLLAAPLAAQQPPPPAKQAPKAKKVWTNDDLIELRRPADKYEDAKEKAEKIARAQEALEKEKAGQKPAAPAAPAAEKEKSPDDWLPKTVEECEKLIAAKKEEIENQKKRIENTRMILDAATTENAREVLQKRLAEEQANLKEAEEELELLEAHLEKLNATPPKPEKP
ncbi:MAG TPA: hypothetical protein VNL38_01570 [Candidatus Nitrosotenuis sp.]|nr:hypothetical protein [Candidatus Nitrosotenuis sp.]